MFSTFSFGANYLLIVQVSSETTEACRFLGLLERKNVNFQNVIHKKTITIKSKSFIISSLRFKSIESYHQLRKSKLMGSKILFSADREKVVRRRGEKSKENVHIECWF